MDGTRRRTLLGGALAGAAALAGCTDSGETPQVDPSRIAAAEDRRRRAGAPVREAALTAAPAHVDLGGPVVETWAYGGRIPGTPLRLTAGEVLRVRVRNDLPTATSVHWHGLVIRNDVDGVPGVTQPEIAPGATVAYEFAVPDAGTYWLHPHTGLQLDRGLYAPLIVDDPAEPGRYDVEEIVVFDDWLDGVAGRSPAATMEQLSRSGGGMMGGRMMDGAGGSALLGGSGGDVAYPLLLANGRVAAAPRTINARPGARLRLRLINASADTAFRVALGGHVLMVTHADGWPVAPVRADAVLLGMGERMDVSVTLGDGAFPLIGAAEGKGGSALMVVRTAGGATPGAVEPKELAGRVVTGLDVRAVPGDASAAIPAARAIPVRLGGGMHSYQWTINGRQYPDTAPLLVDEGERVALVVSNQTMMFHPVHLHGHTFRLTDSGGAHKDTVIVRPGERQVLLLDAVNPGAWMLHCHNAYHAEAGMMTILAYR